MQWVRRSNLLTSTNETPYKYGFPGGTPCHRPAIERGAAAGDVFSLDAGTVGGTRRQVTDYARVLVAIGTTEEGRHRWICYAIEQYRLDSAIVAEHLMVTEFDVTFTIRMPVTLSGTPLVLFTTFFSGGIIILLGGTDFNRSEEHTSELQSLT